MYIQYLHAQRLAQKSAKPGSIPITGQAYVSCIQEVSNSPISTLTALLRTQQQVSKAIFFTIQPLNSSIANITKHFTTPQTAPCALSHCFRYTNIRLAIMNKLIP